MGKDLEENVKLKVRIQDLEQELGDREGDITLLRNELVSTSQRIEEFIGQVASDLKLLHAIQYIVMPTELPQIPGFEFSHKFLASAIRGGDYFEVMEHNDKTRFGIFLSAASRYTMSSLLLSAVLQKSPLVQSQRGLPPGHFLKSLLTEMNEMVPAVDTADLFYGVVDRRKFVFSYCLLGTVLALHQLGESGELKILKQTGPQISSNSLENEILENQVQLHAEDRIILVSRGLVEAKNSSGEEFGRERIFGSVLAAPSKGAHELRNRVFYDLNQFTENAELLRDQTLLVAEVKDRVVTLVPV